MSDERPIFSAGAFNPEAFAEWWLEHEWEKQDVTNSPVSEGSQRKA